MISLNKKRDVFILWFIKRHTKREVSRVLNISRGSVDKIINECQQRINELNLRFEADLLSYIDEIVVAPSMQRKRKPYKLNEETISFIKELVINNEKLTRIDSEDAMSTKELFEFFRKQKKEKPNLITDFSLDNFYKQVKKIKNEIHDKGI
ncbi:hypothetical protein [Caldibacillus thermoamylovorans]|uniref:hypothetical protein n=1 Tax=Caldibacillus thermoamylovorans TaxID=35841 RepID=UPI00203F04EF|nr:hypothetical protein [Caldibacillus thermoamylovorans]MCM3478952.1 hypothetical protein [Caldibacillus thermoamylovorans]